MKKAGFIIMLIAAAAIFSIQSAAPFPAVVLFWGLEAPLTLVIVAAILVGMLTGGLIAYRPEARTRGKGSHADAGRGEESP